MMFMMCIVFFFIPCYLSHVSVNEGGRFVLICNFIALFLISILFSFPESPPNERANFSNQSTEFKKFVQCVLLCPAYLFDVYFGREI